MENQNRIIFVRRGPLFYEWRYAEDNPSKYRTTKVPRSLQLKDACDLIVHDWMQIPGHEACTVAWEITSEEIQAGKKGVPWPDKVGGLPV